jgi:hypothetical protein
MIVFFKISKFATLFMLLILIYCSTGKNIYNSFGIYLNQDECLILSDTDIEAYIKSDHKIILNQQGMRKWNSYIIYDSNQTPPIPKLTGKLYQNDFSLRLDSDTIYTGKFWSYASSQSCTGIVILDVIFPLDTLHNWISIGNWYEETPMNDLRNNDKIFDFFADKGKLR